MENTEKRKAILFVRVEPCEIYFCRDIATRRMQMLEVYCYLHKIEILVCYHIIGEYESFEKNVLPSLQNNKYGAAERADLLIMHDHWEISSGVITTANLLSKVRRLGLEVVFIKIFIIKRYSNQENKQS
ncbi:MAG: hypothetical protein JWP12_2462 [Bacteroidetes bacterium]|nr:hypothetical protein [Bacteroidota bacterium]